MDDLIYSKFGGFLLLLAMAAGVFGATYVFLRFAVSCV